MFKFRNLIQQSEKQFSFWNKSKYLFILQDCYYIPMFKIHRIPNFYFLRSHRKLFENYFLWELETHFWGLCSGSSSSITKSRIIGLIEALIHKSFMNNTFVPECFLCASIENLPPHYGPQIFKMSKNYIILDELL